MPPAEGRFEERLKLAALPYADLLKLAAKGAHHSADARRDADARLAAATPLSDHAVAVLLSPDLAPQLLTSLDLADYAAALACKAWSVAWAAKTRRVLRLTPLPTPDFKLERPPALATLPGGERLAIAGNGQRVQIVDKQMRLQHTLGDDASGVKFGERLSALAAGDGGLYVAERQPTRLRRLQLDTFAVAAELDDGMMDGYDYYNIPDLCLVPGGPLFIVAQRSKISSTQSDRWVVLNWVLLALDALTLEVRFAVGHDVLGGGDLSGLAVGGDEVFVGKDESYHSIYSIRVLSLAGEPRRTIAAAGWRAPRSLCCVAERLYLIEGAGRRVIALTPEGATLQVCYSPQPYATTTSNPAWISMCHFDGKLLVADWGGHGVGGLLALRGI